MADKDFKVKNGIDVAGNANIDGNLNAAKYQDSAPSSPVTGQIWIDSDASAGVLNQNDYLLKADASASSGYLLKTDAANTYETQADAASTYAPLASPTLTGTVTAPKILLTDTTDVSLSSTGNPIQIGPTDNLNLVIDNNEIGVRNNGVGTTMYLNADGGSLGITTTTGANGTTTIGNSTGSNSLVVNGNIQSTGPIRADSGGADGGTVIGTLNGGSDYTGLATNGMTTNEYLIVSGPGGTFISANSGGDVTIRPNANTAAHQLLVDADGAHRLSGALLHGSVGGIGTTTSGANLTVTHGLGATPSAVTATVRSNAYSATNNTNIFVGNFGATTFTVFANNGASGAVAAAFSWIAVA